MNKTILNMVITKEISRDVLENVFVTAIEGGSNYWYCLSNEAVKVIRSVLSKTEEPFMSIAVLKAVLDYGISIPISDADNENDIVGVISRNTMQERLQKLSEDDSCRWALEAEIDGHGDADSSDVVFQYITMGEYIFG
jgi:hypothetical protein